MGLIATAYSSTIGKKVVMAISGLILVGFVIGHMAGNLKVFAGVNESTGLYAIDEYGLTLRAMGEHFVGHGTVLWGVRVVLLAAVLLHIWSAVSLSALNRRARPVGYRTQKYSSANAASLTMFWGGILLALFIVYHILDLTVGTVHPGFVEGQVYANLAGGFSKWYVAAFYIVAMAALAMHLYHGVWSMFQTFGVDSPRWNGGIRAAAKVLSVLLFFGFSAVPAAFMLGMIARP